MREHDINNMEEQSDSSTTHMTSTRQNPQRTIPTRPDISPYNMSNDGQPDETKYQRHLFKRGEHSHAKRRTAIVPFVLGFHSGRGIHEGCVAEIAKWAIKQGIEEHPDMLFVSFVWKVVNSKYNGTVMGAQRYFGYISSERLSSRDQEEFRGSGRDDRSSHIRCDI